MKTSIKILLFAALISLTSNLYSQPQFPPPPQNGDMLKQLVEKLNLNDEQVEKVELILNSTRNKMKDLRNKMEDERDNSMDKMQSIMKEQDKEIEKLLTAEQKKKFAELQKERNNRRPPMGDKQGPPPPPDGNRPNDRF